MKPANNLEEQRLSLISQLPTCSMWFVWGTPVRWDFSRAAQPLQHLPEDDAAGWEEILPLDWRQILIFGEQDISDGGGARPFLGLHVHTGEVVGLDIERTHKSVLFVLNSAVSAFINTFLILDNELQAEVLVPRDFSERIRALDPDSFEKSEWKFLVDYLNEPLETDI